MISFHLNTHIYRPLKQVFAFVAAPENDFQWQYGTLASTRISEGEMGIGSMFRTVSHFMGRRMESVCEVTEFEPNHRYGFKSLSGPVDSHTVYTFEMTETSTKIEIFTETDPRDLFETNDVIVEKKSKRQYKEYLATLKNILEAQRLNRTEQ